MSRKWVGLLLFLPWLPGCGLADYDARMARAQEKQQRWDEANRLLDKPLIPPSRQEKGMTVPLASFFLRPPKGINDQPDAQPRGELLYTYRPRARPLAGGSATAGPFLFVELAVSSGQKDFAADVMRIYSAQDKPVTSQRRIQTAEREVVFNTTEFEEANGRVSVNITSAGDKSLAIVYWVLRGQQAAAARAIQVSLESFGTGGEVGKLQTLYANGPWKAAGR